MQIRHAVEEDLPGILAIYNDAILHTTAVYDYTPHTIEMRLAWLRAKQESDMPVFVADDAGRIAGFSALGPFRAWAAYRYTVENSIYVGPDDRGRGLGRLLLAPLIEAAHTMGMHAIVAGVDADNQASYRLHRSFGFEEVAHFRQVGYKFDRWLDLKFLELLLDEG